MTWARRAPRRHVLLAVASISLVGVLLVVFVNVNIHEQTAILMFVIMAAVVELVCHSSPCSLNAGERVHNQSAFTLHGPGQ